MSTSSWQPPVEAGEFKRKDTGFRDWIRKDGSTPFLPEAGRYHLYVSLACPWAHRTVLIRSLRKLTDAISMSVVEPVWNENGWCFGTGPGATLDTVNHQPDLLSVYRLADPGFQEEETTPVLWDKKSRTIVSNESREILRMLDVEFAELGDPSVNLAPPPLVKKIDETITALYQPVNNGVYRCGFATSQRAYERAFQQLFQALDHWNGILASQRMLCGDQLTEADLCFFTTLVRFDAVYYTHFKCNLRRIKDYPHLSRYLRELYQTPGVKETCDFDHIKRHYFMCHTQLNPGRIVPLGPELDLG